MCDQPYTVAFSLWFFCFNAFPPPSPLSSLLHPPWLPVMERDAAKSLSRQAQEGSREKLLPWHHQEGTHSPDPVGFLCVWPTLRFIVICCLRCVPAGRQGRFSHLCRAEHKLLIYQYAQQIHVKRLPAGESWILGETYSIRSARALLFRTGLEREDSRREAGSCSWAVPFSHPLLFVQ